MRGLGVLLVLALAAATAVAADGPGPPRIRVDPEGFDFGRVLTGRTLRKEFRLRNLGTGDLVIERVSKSCGCTEAAVEATTLEPGESTPLVVKLSTPSRARKVEEQVLLRSNDPRTPLLEIRLSATVEEEEEEER
jgi:hypothetical protein